MLDIATFRAGRAAPDVDGKPGHFRLVVQLGHLSYSSTAFSPMRFMNVVLS
jgi:hypothetical protein